MLSLQSGRCSGGVCESRPDRAARRCKRLPCRRALLPGRRRSQSDRVWPQANFPGASPHLGAIAGLGRTSWRPRQKTRLRALCVASQWTATFHGRPSGAVQKQIPTTTQYTRYAGPSPHMSTQGMQHSGTSRRAPVGGEVVEADALRCIPKLVRPASCCSGNAAAMPHRLTGRAVAARKDPIGVEESPGEGCDLALVPEGSAPCRDAADIPKRQSVPRDRMAR